MLKLLALLLSMLGSAQAQNFIQIPACGNSLPASVRPSAPTITMNPSGQVCIAGNFSATVTVPTPQIATPLAISIPQVGAVVSGSYADGALVTLGQVGESAYKTVNTSGDVIALLKGIFGNVMTPISVTGSFAPAAATGVDITHVASQQIASPSTYGVAPVGSVLGVNAFVTNAPSVTINGSPQTVITGSTPLAITVASSSSPINVTGNFTAAAPASPQGVALSGIGTNLTPQNVTVANGNANGLATMANSSPVVVASDQTPISVNIATASSPINVTGNFTAAVAASPQGVGIAPGSSPLSVSLKTTPVDIIADNVNANGLATMANSSPVVIAQDQTPIQVTVVTGINLATPLNVTIAASPLNVTGSFTSAPPAIQAVNVASLASQNLASPSTYGIAPVGSVQGVNAFVTSLPASPLGVGIAGFGAGATPQNMTLATTPLGVALIASPINVTQSQTPQNITIAQTPLNVTLSVSPISVVQTQSPQAITLPASPISVGVVGFGSPQNITIASPASPINVTQSQSPQNVTVGNGNANGLATSANSSPVVVASDSNVRVFTSLPTANAVVAHTATQAYAVTNSVIALGVTPGLTPNSKQLAQTWCQTRSPVVTPIAMFLQVFSSSVTETTLGTTRPKLVIAITGTPLTTGAMPAVPAPGIAFTALSFALVQGPAGSSTAVGTTVDCTFVYN